MTARKIFTSFIIAVVLILPSNFYLLYSVHADEVTDREYNEITKQLEDLKKAREMSEAATRPLESTLQKLKGDLDNIIVRIQLIEADLQRKKENIENGEQKLGEQEIILAKRVKSFYIRRSQINPLAIIFSKKTPGDWLRELAYQQAATDEDKRVIIEIVLYVKDLENKKKELENENQRLAAIKLETDKQATFFQKEITGAKTYQENLTKEIAVLSVKQQQILATRISSLHLPTSLGGGPLVCTDDRNVDPGFRPAFAFFSYGIPHRVGMNQYGAKGRADAGQRAEDILRAYFPNTELKTDYNTGININVSGANESGQNFDLSWDIETYVKHIYEMPTSWNPEALKAQAVAARSYALAYTKNGANSICATQACQVVKLEENSDAWKSAVDNTRGWVLVNNGEPISAWFASTAGGYTWGSGDVWCNESTYTGSCASKPWTGKSRDTNGDIGSFGDLASKSYDKDSPCFYSAQGWRSEYGKSAWIKSEELADIVNVLLLVKLDSGAADHLYQPDKSHPYGGEIWNQDRVKQELRNRHPQVGPFNSISDVSVSADFGTGKTTTVNITGDAGSVSLDGLEFKSYFSIRAPANISIVGPLFNVEKR